MKKINDIKKDLLNFELVSLFNQKFNNVSIFDPQSLFNKIVLNFSFKQIDFEKKRMLPFLLVLELLSNQKVIYTKNLKKSALRLKLRQNSIVGCKVTLRDKNLYIFLLNFALGLTRTENLIKFNTIKLKKTKNENFNFTLFDIFMFPQLENEFYDFIQYLNVNIKFKTKSFQQKLFLLTF